MYISDSLKCVLFQDSEDDEIVDYIPGLPPMRLCDLPQIFNVKGQKMYKSFKPCVDELSKAKYLVFSSAYELEPKAVEFLTSKFDFPVYAVGPLIPFQDLSAGHDGNEPDYIQWLNKQPESSVLYVSQGSFHSASEAQLEEIVRGVRESGVRFLWVARGSETKLKKAFEGSSGIAVSWCDQLRVLSHIAIGGFMTHCGFNSTLEGLYTGTPMLVFPFNWDQIMNAKMVVEEWKVGMKIKEKKKDLLVKKEEVKELVKKFMDGESEEGKEMRRRAYDFSETCRRAVEENGSSYRNIDAFVKDLAKDHSVPVTEHQTAEG